MSHRMSLGLTMALATSLACATPTLAFEEQQASPPENVSLKNPLSAAQLSFAAPLLCIALTPLTVGVSLLVAPWAAGAGQIYAGDWGRAGSNGLGGLAVLGGAAAIGGGIGALFPGSYGGSLWSAVAGGVIGSGVAIVGFGIWSANDAYYLTEAKNKELLQARPQSSVGTP